MEQLHIYKSEEPRFYLQADTNKIMPLINTDVFIGKVGLYQLKDDTFVGEKFMYIDSYRDADIHKTLWRLLGESGRSITVDCLDVIPCR